MKIVVIGGLGHIGSALIRKLPQLFPGAEILIIDNLLTQRYCSLFELPANGRYRFIEADIFQAPLAQITAGADAVVHLAAITDATSSFGNPEQVEKVNLEGTQIIARACADSAVPLIFLSTTSVYGVQTEIVDESCPKDQLKPQSPYAASKLKAEESLKEMGHTQGLKFVTLRFGTIFGISPGMRFHTAVNKFIWQASLQQPITVWRTAMDQNRPYLDLTDGVRAICHVVQNKLFINDIFNVVTINASVRNIIEAIEEEIGRKAKIQLVDSTIMNQLSYHVLSDKFASTGFSFQGNLGQGVKESVALLRSAFSVS